MDYVSFLRKHLGKETVLLPFSAGILSNQEGKVLLQKRSDTETWGLPGGCMEIGESSIQTLKREFMEETGLRIEPLRLLNVYTDYLQVYPNGDQAQTIGFVYEVKTTDEISPDFQNSETLTLSYFSCEEIARINIFNPQHELMIQEFFEQSFKMGW